MNRGLIVAEARSWLGTPWVHQHCAKGVGVDCAQLVMAVGEALGLLPAGVATRDYGRHPDGTIERMCAAHLEPVARDDMKPGDVVVVRVATQPQHLGIVGDYQHGGLSIIHASGRASTGVIETRLMFARGFTFVSAHKFRGVEA